MCAGPRGTSLRVVMSPVTRRGGVVASAAAPLRPFGKPVEQAGGSSRAISGSGGGTVRGRCSGGRARNARTQPDEPDVTLVRLHWHFGAPGCTRPGSCASSGQLVAAVSFLLLSMLTLPPSTDVLLSHAARSGRPDGLRPFVEGHDSRAEDFDLSASLVSWLSPSCLRDRRRGCRQPRSRRQPGTSPCPQPRPRG
jgi:hypothetical protein